MKARPLSKRKISQRLSQLLLLLPLWVVACGGGSDSNDSVSSGGVGQTMTGSIKSITGSQSEMNQWVLALVERDSGIAHVGVVNAVGNFAITGVDLSLAHTLVLLDPQFKLASLLTFAGVDSNKVRQYFRTSQTLLPVLAHNGPTINFSDLSGINWEAQQANDADADLIPDGRDLASLRLAATDSDVDGLDNEVDSDIDGDGIANWFDGDDDGDGIIDAFDADANGDSEADLNQALGDLYFKSFIQYMVVQITQDVQEDESLATSLTFTAKMHEGAQPSAVKVRAPKVLTDGAKAIVFNQERNESVENSWDMTLVDDGLNGDGAAKDLTYARQIKLAKGAVPKANQVLFVQYDTGSETTLRTREFAYTVPELVSGVIKGQYDTESRTVSLEGTPFGELTEFRWSVHIFDAAGSKVFASAPIPGTTPIYEVPANVLESGQSYTARVVATSGERIPSFPTWIIRSVSFSL